MKQILCPQCKKPTHYSLENPNRPFCSERCKLIDLGQWAEESYKIAGKEDDLLSLGHENHENEEK